VARSPIAEAFNESDSPPAEVGLERKLLQWFDTGATKTSAEAWISDTDLTLKTLN